MQNINLDTIILIFVGILILVLIALYILIKKSKKPANDFTYMAGEEFEEYCARLLYKRGFTNIELTPGSHDYGIDIFAELNGITYAIQCKCYSDTVGIKAVQEAYAGRDYYDKMIGVVMTNQYFSGPAREFADKLRILLWDGDYIARLESEKDC